MSSRADCTQTTIGLFDSGVGGLSVLRRLQGLKAEKPLRFVYVGDTARCPYGDRPQEEIERFAVQITSFLLLAGAGRLVIACNTSAALAGDAARRLCPYPVHDLISAGARYASSISGKIAVMATAGTVRTGAFARAIAAFRPEAQVVEIACPDLVPLIERGQLIGPAMSRALSNYARLIEESQASAVVLGCTHFPFLSGMLASMLGPAVELIDPAEHLAAEIAGSLGAAAAGPGEANSAEFHVTGDGQAFRSAAAACDYTGIGTIYSITIGDLEAAAARQAAAMPLPVLPVHSSQAALPGLGGPH